MAVTTVAQLATELNRPAAALLEQLESAGVSKKSASDALTDADKERLLEFLRSAHGTGGERKKITLVRKSTSEIKQADASGKSRTIQVEVRKKRVFVKRDDLAPAVDEAAAAAAAAAAEQAEQAELRRREAEAQAQAEALRKQEEELAERRRQREEQERAEREAAEARAREQAAAAQAAAAEAAAAAAAKKEPAPAAPATMAAQPAPAAPAVAAAPAAEPAPKPALRVVKASTIEAEDKARQADLDRRRKLAENEAAAIRAMLNAPKKVLIAKPVEPPKPAAPKEGITGTIHKPKAAPGAAAGPAKPGDKKAVKSEKLSSSWADDAAKRRAAAKPRTDGGAGGRPGWRAPRGARRGEARDSGGSGFVAPAEFVVQEVHVPETISVADLAHKMSVKASELIKQLMKLGQMVTINQQLDQETAMILVEEMGHKAVPAKLDDPEAFLEEEEAATTGEDQPRAPVVTV
ncbi:MAG TPA: translation initiation factor IF-2 N-terminal domain-containing protein, partial [Rubrivivax sp.]|nr:translation initiation factor IF-2 N-terminal domain-containing protein [Rubrivivax sp.]